MTTGDDRPRATSSNANGGGRPKGASVAAWNQCGRRSISDRYAIKVYRTTRKYSCRRARRTLVRYAKTKKEPKGWDCWKQRSLDGTPVFLCAARGKGKAQFIGQRYRKRT